MQSPKKQQPTLSSHISLGRLKSMSHCSLEVLWTPDCGVLECGGSFSLVLWIVHIKNITGVRAGTRVHSLRDVGSGALLSGCVTLFPSASSTYEVNCFLCSGKPSERGWGLKAASCLGVRACVSQTLLWDVVVGLTLSGKGEAWMQVPPCDLDLL